MDVMDDGIPPIEQPDMPPAPSGDETTAGFAISIPSKLHPPPRDTSSSFSFLILPGVHPSWIHSILPLPELVLLHQPGYSSLPASSSSFSSCGGFILLPPLPKIILAFHPSISILLFHILRQFFLPIFIHILHGSILPSFSHPAIQNLPNFLLLLIISTHSLLFILFSKIWTSSLWNSASSPKISSFHPIIILLILKMGTTTTNLLGFVLFVRCSRSRISPDLGHIMVVVGIPESSPSTVPIRTQRIRSLKSKSSPSPSPPLMDGSFEDPIFSRTIMDHFHKGFYNNCWPCRD